MLSFLQALTWVSQILTWAPKARTGHPGTLHYCPFQRRKISGVGRAPGKSELRLELTIVQRGHRSEVERRAAFLWMSTPRGSSGPDGQITEPFLNTGRPGPGCTQATESLMVSTPAGGPQSLFPESRGGGQMLPAQRSKGRTCFLRPALSLGRSPPVSSLERG